MSDYLLMLRFDILRLVNYIVEIKRTPKKLIGYLLFIGWLCLFIVPQFTGNRKSPLHVNETVLHVIFCLFIISICSLIFVTLFSSLKKSYYTFSMGDVNLLFPSPLEPQRILFWSMLKKIPASFFITLLPVLLLTPALSDLGLGAGGIFFIYVSFVSLSLLLSPLAFFVFLLSVRYQKETWMRTILTGAVLWLAGSWLWQVKGGSNFLDLLTGYQAAGIWHFPVIGWILRLAYAGFYGAGSDTYRGLLWLVLTLILVMIAVYWLAKDYYEDVLGRAEKMSAARKRKMSGRPRVSELFAKSGGAKTVTVKGTYAGSRAFLFKQIVNYRSTGFNEYLGKLAPLALAAGLLTGFFISFKSMMDPSSGLYIINGMIAYILILTTSTSSISAELALPYIYVLPGTFLKKVVALNTLPILRFAVNIFLLNLSYTLMAKGDGKIWATSLIISLIMITIYFELLNSVIVGNVLLPSSLDRKVFYPLLLLIQFLVIAVPAGIIGGGLYLAFRSVLALALGIIVANVGVGFLLLAFSGKMFSYIEMREFDDLE